jgi:hypothetical protein
MSNEIGVTPPQEGTAPPAAEASPAPDQVTSGAPPQEGTSATPDSEAQRLKKSQETRERIEELAARAKAGTEYGEYWRSRFEESQRQTSQQPTAAPVQAEQPDPEPSEDAFEDPKQYAKAYAAWIRKETAKEVAQVKLEAKSIGTKAAQDAMAKAAEETRLKSLNDGFGLRQQQFAEKTPDYEVAVKNPALTFFNGQVLEALMASEKGPEIAYYIAKSPKEVARLAGQTIPQRLASLGRIEAELSRPPPPPKVTAAPAPPTPIGGGAGGEVDPSKLSTADWIARRTAEIRSRQGRQR